MLADYMPFLAMVLVQFGYAGMNITSKLAMETGMNPVILVAYRQILATFAIIPFAYFLEWKTMPKLSKHVFFLIFLCSLTGATMNQMFYLVGLNNSTPTIGCALTNILPAFTFVLAVLFRQESVRIKTKAGQAKVVGTIVCVGGAMLLSFYHGHIIGIGSSNFHWRYLESMTDTSSGNGQSILGPIFLIASAVAWALWFIIQAKVSKSFPAPYTSSALMCLLSSVQCAGIGVIVDHRPSSWSLIPSIRLVAALYAAVVCSALAFSLMSWSIQKRGALYVSVFSPLLLVIVAVLSWAMLHEKLYIGTVVGSFLIVAGLYAVLWGKDKEMELETESHENDHLELKQHKGSGDGDVAARV